MANEQFFSSSTGRIAYLDLGAGPTILFVHGFCEEKSMFEPFHNLQEQYRLIIPDLPGFGSSDTIEETGAMESYTQALKELTEALHVDRFIYVGHSMGAYVGLDWMAQEPDRFLAFSLFHSHPFADAAAKKAARQKSIDFLQKHGSQTYLKPFLTALFPEHKRAHFAKRIDILASRSKTLSAAAIIFALEAMMHRQDHADTLTHFPRPVQCIVGELDDIAPVEFGLGQVHLAPTSLFHLISDCGHMGQWECPNIIREKFQVFLELIQTLK